MSHCIPSSSSHIIIDCTLLFPPLASAAQNGNTRVQPIMLRKLAGKDQYIYSSHRFVI